MMAPWRGGNAYRERSWKIVRDYYAPLISAYVADSTGDPFSTAEAYNRAAALAGDWDIGIFINTDVVVPIENIQLGCVNAIESQRITLPHDEWYNLRHYEWPAPLPDPSLLRDRSVGKAPAGVIIIPRTVWDRVGGYDERFRTWGYEDAAMLRRAGVYDRLPGPLFHYYHPRRGDGTDPAALDLWVREYRSLPVPTEHLVTGLRVA